MTIKYEPIGRSWYSSDTLDGDIRIPHVEKICNCGMCSEALAQKLGNNIDQVILPQPDGKDQDSQP